MTDDSNVSGFAGADKNAVILVALLLLSNDADGEKDPFKRRLILNEIQDGIQANRDHIVALAEGLMFVKDQDPPNEEPS